MSDWWSVVRHILTDLWLVPGLHEFQRPGRPAEARGHPEADATCAAGLSTHAGWAGIQSLVRQPHNVIAALALYCSVDISMAASGIKMLARERSASTRCRQFEVGSLGLIVIIWYYMAPMLFILI